jgi:hypothetical protein
MMRYDRYGHRHRGLRAGTARLERHFGGSVPKAPPPPPPPAATDPVPQKAVSDARAAAKRRRGLAASILSGTTSGELSPAAGERKEFLG